MKENYQDEKDGQKEPLRGPSILRFKKATKEEIENSKMPVFANATLRSADSAWRAFCDWRQCDQAVNKTELGNLLCSFALEHRKQDGEDYKSSSLLTIMRGVVRKAFLLSLDDSGVIGSPWKFDDDAEFAAARNTLDRRMRDMQKAQMMPR